MATKLTREFRFAWRGIPLPDSSSNSWAGWGSTLEPAAHLVLQVTVSGAVRRPSGYICNIRALDESLRTAVNRVAAAAAAARLTCDELLRRVADELPHVFSNAGNELQGIKLLGLRMLLSPQLSLSYSWEEAGMLKLTQQFEFSAAHRLHCREWTAAENRAAFGKCNNPNGHGHNYLVEVSVELPAEAAGAGPRWSLGQLESTVKRVVIDRFDHQHLNADVTEFRDLNPSVENIAEVCFGLLAAAVAPLRLVNVRVYETPKTWADRSA